MNLPFGKIGSISLCLLLAGCSNTQTSDFYPLAPAGNVISSLGNAVSGVGFHRALPTEYVTDITEDQLRYIETIAVVIPHEHIQSPTLALGAGLGQPIYAQQIPIIAQVEYATGRRFRWYLNPILPDIAMALPGGIIVINPDVMAGHHIDTQIFFLFHEAAHHIDQHTSLEGQIAATQQAWLRPAFELRADCFAAKMMAQYGVPPNRIIYALMAASGNNPRTASHPSGQERIANVRACLQ